MDICLLAENGTSKHFREQAVIFKPPEPRTHGCFVCFSHAAVNDTWIRTSCTCNVSPFCACCIINGKLKSMASSIFLNVETYTLLPLSSHPAGFWAFESSQAGTSDRCDPLPRPSTYNAPALLGASSLVSVGVVGLSGVVLFSRPGYLWHQ